MSLVTKNYTPVNGQAADAPSYNTDIAAIVNTINGIDEQTTALHGVTVTPSTNSTETLKVTNVAGTSQLTVDTTGSQIVDNSTNGIVSVYGIFHDRGDAAALDYNITALYPSGNNTDWHDLDLSAIIPAGAKTVLLNISVTANATDGIYFKKGGNSNDFNRADILCPVNAQEHRAQLIVACNANRVIQYKTPFTTATVINVFISGWWK